MAGIATLSTTLPSVVVLEWDCVMFEHGHPELDQVFTVQPLTSMGVDNTRLRLPRKDFPPFKMNLLRGVTDFAAAVTLARSVRGVTGFLCTFVHTAAGVLYTPTTTFYVLDVVATPRPGPFLGGETVPAGAFIESAITLQATGVAP